MNILYVLDYYHPHIGSVEIVLQRLAESLAAKGHRMRVITTHNKEFPNREMVNGVEIENIVGEKW